MADEIPNRIEVLVRQIGATFAMLAGSVVVFYALGFLIVQCFISSAGVDGMFWFSREYYEEAGGKFLVDIIRTPLMKPVFFAVYLFALLLLVPSEEVVECLGSSKEKFIRAFTRLSACHMGQALTLLAAAVVTYFFVARFDDLAGRQFFVDRVLTVFFWSEAAPNDQKQVLLFFSITVPMVVALSFLLHRLFKHWESRSRTMTALCLYIVFVSILPISYGRCLYDIKAVPINDPKRIYALAGMQAEIADTSKMWFLGRFGGKYLFLRRDNLLTDRVDIRKISLGGTQGVVESLDEKDVKNMSFTLERADSLRNLMRAQTGGAFEQEARKVIDELFQ